MNSTKSSYFYFNICRVCLTENYLMKSLSAEEEIMQEKRSLSYILLLCSSVEIVEGDGLPERICLSCVQELRRAFLFRQLSEKSDATLRELIAPQDFRWTGFKIRDFGYNESGPKHISIKSGNLV